MDTPTGFDVIVVGGGTAGCVVAARLAEGGRRSVILLEAGPDRRHDVTEPLRDGWNLARGADWAHDWGYVTEPDANGTSEPVRRGRLVGGTSWLTRFAVRGSTADFDGWGRSVDPDWAFDRVLPSFTRLEADADFGDAPWHGDGGPITVDRYLEHAPSPIHGAALEAILASGIPAIDDVNAPGAVGVGRMPMSSREGRRMTTADAYLPAGRTPARLTIRAEAQVAGILFDGDLATGVRLMDGGEVLADQVVLCAGTYGTPPILMRSGVGPAEHLRGFGIAVRVDLPGVGANLADHVGAEVLTGWRGPGRAAPVVHSIATFHSAGAHDGDAADLMFWVGDPVGDDAEFTVDPVLLKPHSRGSVQLRSADPTDPPRIELPGLREPTDVERLAEAYRRGVDIANRPELRRWCPGPAPTDPGAAGARRLVADEAYSIPHVVGTCAMGRSPDDGAVVDGSGAVHGIRGLHVVDASIMPDAPSGFPHLITIMLAERLAERLAQA